jgi:hypothetical protein
MATSRSLIIALPLLGVLTAGIVLFQKFGSAEKQSAPRPLAENFRWDETERISIEKETQKAILQRNSKNEWTIENDNSFAADATKITRLLDSLTGAKIERTVTKKADNTDEFGLGSKAAKLNLESKGKIQLSIVLGEARAGGGQYFKFADRDSVYLLSAALRPEVESDSWAYKTLLRIPKKEVRSVQWSEGKKLSATTTYARKKESDKFELSPAKAAVTEENFNQLLDRLENLSFEKRKPRTDNSAADSLSLPVRSVTLSLFDGRMVTLVSGAPLQGAGGWAAMDISISVDPSSGKALSTAQAEEKAKLDDSNKKYIFLFPAEIAIGSTPNLSGRRR